MGMSVLLTINGKQKSVLFREPLWREAMIWREEIADLSLDINAKKYFFFKPSNKDVLGKHEKLMETSFKYLTILNEDKTFQAEEDFYELPAIEVSSLFVWLVKAVSPNIMIPTADGNNDKTGKNVDERNNIYR